MAGSFTISARAAAAAAAASQQAEGAGAQPARPPQRRTGVISDYPSYDMAIRRAPRGIGCSVASPSAKAAIDSPASSLATAGSVLRPRTIETAGPVEGRTGLTVI